MPFSNGGFDLMEWWRSLHTEQRLSVVLFICCGFLTLGLSAVYLSSHLRSPFMAPVSLLDKVRPFYQQQQQDANSLEDLKTKDTDHDGLSDYSELFTYHTSPYLDDSDSDGTPDPVEISMGTDPNCPKGQVCHEVLDSNPPTSTESGSFTDLLANSRPVMPTSTAANLPSGMEGIKGFLDNPASPDSMTPDQIRTYLVDTGLTTQDKLDPLSDDEVVQLYNATYQQALQMKSAAANPISLTPSAVSSSLPSVPSVTPQF